MSSSAIKRHIALALTLAVAVVAFTATSSPAGTSSGTSGPWSNWMPIADGVDDEGCGSDGDPDNPTVDRPRSSSDRIDGHVVVVDPPSGMPSMMKGLWEMWLSRVLQLKGIY